MPKLTDMDYVHIPTQLLDGAAGAMAHGNTKYGAGLARDRKSIDDRFNSLMGHLQSWHRGEPCDPESGLCHLKHAAAQLAFLMEAAEELDEELARIREGQNG